VESGFVCASGKHVCREEYVCDNLTVDTSSTKETRLLSNCQVCSRYESLESAEEEAFIDAGGRWRPRAMDARRALLPADAWRGVGCRGVPSTFHPTPYTPTPFTPAPRALRAAPRPR